MHQPDVVATAAGVVLGATHGLLEVLKLELERLERGEDLFETLAERVVVHLLGLLGLLGSLAFLTGFFDALVRGEIALG